jgi:hypothetical protein
MDTIQINLPRNLILCCTCSICNHIFGESSQHFQQVLISERHPTLKMQFSIQQIHNPIHYNSTSQVALYHLNERLFLSISYWNPHSSHIFEAHLCGLSNSDLAFRHQVQLQSTGIQVPQTSIFPEYSSASGQYFIVLDIWPVCIRSTANPKWVEHSRKSPNVCPLCRSIPLRRIILTILNLISSSM